MNPIQLVFIIFFTTVGIVTCIVLFTGVISKLKKGEEKTDPEVFVVQIEDILYEIPEKVFDLIHNISKERDDLKNPK